MNNSNVDIRWQQRFDNLQAAYKQLQNAVTENKKQPDNQLIQMALNLVGIEQVQTYLRAKLS